MTRLVFALMFLSMAFAEGAFAQAKNRQRAGGTQQNFIGSASKRVAASRGKSRGATTNDQAQNNSVQNAAAAPTPAPAPAPAQPQPKAPSETELRVQEAQAELMKQIAAEEAEAAERRKAELAAIEAKEERERQKLRERQAISQKTQNKILNAGDSCQGILSDLNGVLSLAGWAEVSSVIGTVTGAAALIAGIAKAMTDSEIDKVETELLSGKGEFGPDPNGDDAKNLERLTTLQKYVVTINRKSLSKGLGHVRTGGLAVTTATSVAAAVTSGMGASRMDDIIKKMKACDAEVAKIKTLDAEMAANGIEGSHSTRVAASGIIAACPGFDISVVESIQKQMTTTTVISGVGAAVAGVGTGLSIAANSEKIRNDDSDPGKKKEKNLNLAANIAAGVATATSGFSAWFSDYAGKKVTTQAQVAARCEAAF